MQTFWSALLCLGLATYISSGNTHATTLNVPNPGLWVGSATINQGNAPNYTSTNVIPTASPLNFRLIVLVDTNAQAHLLQEVILATTTHGHQIYISATTIPPTVKEAQRISSVAFPFMPPLSLTNEAPNKWSRTITVEVDDPINPFRHRYNPLHQEGRTVSRNITLLRTNWVEQPLIQKLEGIYREKIGGLTAQDLYTKGTFTLERISGQHQLED